MQSLPFREIESVLADPVRQFWLSKNLEASSFFLPLVPPFSPQHPSSIWLLALPLISSFLSLCLHPSFFHSLVLEMKKKVVNVTLNLQRLHHISLVGKGGSPV